MVNDFMVVSFIIFMVVEWWFFFECVLDLEWWINVMVEDFEIICIGMCLLIQFVFKGKCNVVIFDIQDEMGEFMIDDEMLFQLFGIGFYFFQLE